ncbi:battenin [Anoplophora glabripennis]|uniref:battenin n=1 Tax=Anoplophora glabripennis TaxID=217634 RepID=UPI0008743DC1|nr:battenin [Anoplophora glabripennis]XP_018571332.1 battenin [Anoplophora glabripennis]XP_018571333.1 battenin [Anoplophora glabripennis]XP_018571334.1 battenin [Anoplophora glabripennis]
MTDYQSCTTILPPIADQKLLPKNRRIRSLVAYWILGLCNNYGYVVMLTAANDIIVENTNEEEVKSKTRECTYMSTGIILLADILPGLTIKLIAPFLPFFIHIRVIICVLLAAGGYLVVAFSNSLYLSIVGVVLTSFCSGFGEATYLQYSSYYDKNVISTWSSGTGGAGVIGALSYSILQRLGMRTTLLIMLVIPLSMAISFWIILPKPSEQDIAHALEIQKIVNNEEMKNPKAAIKKKLSLIPGLMKYIIPFSLVYLFEYFINQGTFELIQFKDSFVSQQAQYRWLQVTYQVGVFLSRSSVNLFHIRQTWIMTIFQGINVVIFTTEVIYYYIPNFYIVIALTLWEGLLGGSSYVNTFYRISREVPEENKQFSMAITTFGDSIGIALAGVLAIFAHNKICDLPMP